jgi:hypothetical protein
VAHRNIAFQNLVALDSLLSVAFQIGIYLLIKTIESFLPARLNLALKKSPKPIENIS